MKLIRVGALVLCALSSTVFAQTKPSNDPLKPHTKCKYPGGPRIVEVNRRGKSDRKYREVKTANGAEKVSVVDGYRVMFSYEGLPYYFANVKIEQSDSTSYQQDKERIISSLKYFATAKEATPIIFADKSELNGFEHYGIDRDRIDVGGQVGDHVLFDDKQHLVITIYFLNQDDKNVLAASTGADRKFHNIEEYRTLRDDFLNGYSKCLSEVAQSQP